MYFCFHNSFLLQSGFGRLQKLGLWVPLKGKAKGDADNAAHVTLSSLDVTLKISDGYFPCRPVIVCTAVFSKAFHVTLCPQTFIPPSLKYLYSFLLSEEQCKILSLNRAKPFSQEVFWSWTFSLGCLVQIKSFAVASHIFALETESEVHLVKLQTTTHDTPSTIQ